MLYSVHVINFLVQVNISFEHGERKSMTNIYCLDLLYRDYYIHNTHILMLFLYYIYTKQTNTYKCCTLTTCNNKTLIFQTNAYV